MDPKRSFYLVQEGDVTLATAKTDFDNINSILVYAADEQEALWLAELSDRGLAQVSNMHLEDGTVAVCLARENVPESWARAEGGFAAFSQPEIPDLSWEKL